jgi:hypothetical protein
MRDWNGRRGVTFSTLRPAFRLLFALVGGCTAAGAGFSSPITGATPVSFKWRSADSVSGTINAVLSDGRTYSGRFLQVTDGMTVDNLWPLWSGWGPGYRGRGGWEDWDGPPKFVIHYTGRVLANLGAPNGEHMHCRFELIHPSDGMLGGGRGRCRMPDGNTVDATFPVEPAGAPDELRPSSFTDHAKIIRPATDRSAPSHPVDAQPRPAAMATPPNQAPSALAMLKAE